MNRIEKALSERIFLISVDGDNESMKFKLKAQSGNVYEQCLDHETFTCTCPDFEKRHTFCKHLLFLICRVALQMDIGLKLSTNKKNWTSTRFQACCKAWEHRLKHRLSNSGSVGGIGDTCVICFEDMTETDQLTHCRTSCKNRFHQECPNLTPDEVYYGLPHPFAEAA
jgi:hypothetical protein